MDEADKAFRLMMDGQTAGKIIVTRPRWRASIFTHIQQPFWSGNHESVD
jgi:hypothetical protein